MITVFYANLVYGQYHTWKLAWAEIGNVSNNEVYNGGFAYVPIGYVNPGWYTCDGCPYPEDQIDPRLKAWLLLLD